MTVHYLVATFLLNPRRIPRRSGDPLVGANLRHLLRSARPDRVVLWAVLLALVAMLAGAASARAGSGGTGTGGDGDGGGCVNFEFGKRTLSKGDCGSDVETLNWILKAKNYSVPLERSFKDPTDSSVRAYQRKQGFRASGVVNEHTRKAITGSMNRQMASWYGPGFWGNHTACGQTLRKRTTGVAHRSLPCGTKVVIGYKGKYVRTRVIDRGPYVKQGYERDWDLTRATARDVGFEGTDTVRSAVIK